VETSNLVDVFPHLPCVTDIPNTGGNFESMPVWQQLTLTSTTTANVLALTVGFSSATVG